MRQVKLFKGIENGVSELEKAVNEWIVESGAKVVSITGNIAPQSERTGGAGGLGSSSFPPSDVLLTILYDTE